MFNRVETTLVVVPYSSRGPRVCVIDLPSQLIPAELIMGSARCIISTVNRSVVLFLEYNTRPNGDEIHPPVRPARPRLAFWAGCPTGSSALCLNLLVLLDSAGPTLKPGSGVMGWVAQGLTKVLPQPDDKYREMDNDEEHTEIHEVATMPDFDPLPHIPVVEIVSDEESEGAAEVLQKASIKLTPDMVLEDVDSDHEDQQKPKDGSTSLAAPSQTENQQQTQSNPEPEPSESGGRSQEDAETQTGRWTPFIENIKKEAEGVAMATMEERLLQERIEMTRVAEEVAREAAEMAIRQMTSERQSISLSLGSKELLQEEPEEELPELQEEESNLDHCKVTETEQSLAEETEEPITEEPITEQPITEEPITEQPAPISCDEFKSCLMRIPYTSDCLGNINAFFKENGISSSKIPSMPKLPTQLSDVTKFLPTLPPELHQEFSQIRLTQIPRNIAQTLTELMPKTPEGSVSLSLPQSVVDIPQKLSQLPSQAQQYFLNIKNRLNSLMPQDA
ncbi:hypothetical protein EYF80_021575 [Liparis tanakae]|uniref:Uncharacterized protein n=1 Tax=Liparis tanakae TaxID=230148 RepID=A0A4Z2HTG8_9TELE|nr:hypothetical protein EYF80_021575 [Liparis tanakae]